jgi:hypothetical protein
MTAINGFIYRTRAGTRIISPIGLELESPAAVNLPIRRDWGMSTDTIDFCRQQIIRTCWNLRGMRQGCMATHKNRLKRAFADADAREWGNRFTKPPFHRSFNANTEVNPVCALLLDFFGSNKRQKSDIQKWMAGFELHIAKLVLAMEAYCLGRSTAEAMSPDSQMLGNLSWTDDWLTKLPKLAAERFSYAEGHLVHTDVKDMLFCVLHYAAETAFHEFLLVFAQWEKMSMWRTVQNALIVKAVLLKVHLVELERIGHTSAIYYVKQVQQVLRKSNPARTFRQEPLQRRR